MMLGVVRRRTRKFAGHGAVSPLLHQTPWLDAVKRLQFTFLVRREHDGMRRRITNQFDLAYPMGQQPVAAFNLPHGAQAAPGGVWHGSTPICGLA